MQTEKIKSIQRIKPEAVFNLSVMQDESYTANGIVVHNCRSRTIPYFGKIPGKRDFRHTVDGTEFTNKDISKIQNQIKVFKTKYWNIPISEIPRFPG